MQSSGIPHIGNYFGMIRPALAFQDDPQNECFYFIADLHAFTSHPRAEDFKRYRSEVILDWLALGLDPDRSIFYMQSQIPQHTELLWYLLCQTPLGMLERAHSFKDKKARGLDANAGLFTYPVLMAADILLYDADMIPVGKDQKQHVEMARDIAQKFNNKAPNTFVLPEPFIPEETGIVLGTDGQKMSKSYGNTISIFEDEKILRKKIMGLPTDSVPLGQPIDPDTCAVFQFHALFKNPQIDVLRQQYKEGSIGFGESKKQLFAYVWDFFQSARLKRETLKKDPEYIENIIYKGGQKAQERAEKKIQQVRRVMGVL